MLDKPSKKAYNKSIKKQMGEGNALEGCQQLKREDVKIDLH